MSGVRGALSGRLTIEAPRAWWAARKPGGLDWFPHVGTGGNIRVAHRCLDLPPRPLGDRMLNQLATIAGKQGVLGFWITKEIVSVLIPGVLLLLEVFLVLQPQSWANFSTLVNDVKVGGVVLFSIVGICLAYVLGHLARNLEFSIAGWITEPETARKGDRLHSKLMRIVLPWGPHRTEVEMREEIESRLGPTAMSRFLEEYPILDRLLTENVWDERNNQRDQPKEWSRISRAMKFDRSRRGGALEDKPVVEAFGYAKHWLRLESPAFGVEQHELSINIAATLIAPLAMLPLVAWASPTIGTNMLGATVVFSLLGIRWSLNEFRRNREWERLGAIERMLIVWEIKTHKLSDDKSGETRPASLLRRLSLR